MQKGNILLKKYYEILKTVPLFQNIPERDLDSVLDCLKVKTAAFKKGELIIMAGDKPEYVGILLEGQLHIIKEDAGGTRAVIAALIPGEIFAESLCCAAVSESPVSVLADSAACVMLLKFERLLYWNDDSCGFHSVLIGNMLRMIAQKNLYLQSRMDILTVKSIRSKVLRYLESFIPDHGRNIILPFNREELADYLGVDRSALSHELSRMKKDGLIDYHKNKFTLK